MSVLTVQVDICGCRLRCHVAAQSGWCLFSTVFGWRESCGRNDDTGVKQAPAERVKPPRRERDGYPIGIIFDQGQRSAIWSDDDERRQVVAL